MTDTEDRELQDDAIEAAEPKTSKPWLALIDESKKQCHNDYNERCDNIDKRYADMERLANTVRDREFQIFWANIQVLGPSVYSRAPIPVVTPRYKDKKQLPRVASELLERASNVSFESEDIDGIMREIRDDVIVNGRGVARLRYVAKGEEGNFHERVCIDHVNRRDFLHQHARNWKECDWVSFGAWMTKAEMRKRFYKTSGNAYQDASYTKRKDEDGPDDGRVKALVHEIWCKSKNKVVWVTEGVEVNLDEGEPHLTLEGFFPCPKPAFATLQRGTLIPVPDYMFYKDQIEEINELTARISSLAESVRVRGFYPAGASEIGDAIEAAMKSTDDRQIMIGVADWAMLGNGAAKDTIVWFPLEMVTDTIAKLVELRRQLIDDVYQITGLSDIMRGSTVASETLGAQELKSQYGSIRIRDKQDELIRFARDITRIAAEIMAENFQGKTLLDMTQMDIPSDAAIAQQVAQLTQQLQQITADIKTAAQDPEVLAMAEKEPEKAQQIVQQAQQQGQQLQGQIEQVKQTVTIDQIMGMLKEQRIRPFVLDIETDSTIAPDENAQKQRATEFITAVGGFMQQVIPLTQAVPEASTLASEMLKYVAGQFRAGRELQGTIEEFADKMKEAAGRPQGPSPEQMAAQADAQARQDDMAMRQQEGQQRLEEAQMAAQAKRDEFQFKINELTANAQAKAQETQAKAQEDAAKRAVDLEIAEINKELKQLDVLIKQADLKAKGMEISADGQSVEPAEDKTATALMQSIENIGQMIAQLSENTNAQTAMIAQSMTAPKRLVRDQSGRVIGAETAVN